MNQTWENGEKPKLGPDFDLFGQNLEPQVFFRGLYLDYMLNVVASYPCIQFQGKRKIQTQ